jgi:hypothetical protein
LFISSKNIFKKTKGDAFMRTPPPAWFIYILCALILSLMICLFLLPTTAQPDNTGMAKQMRLVFPHL